eukprot:5456-Heterococcus_DN1.PRE.2
MQLVSRIEDDVSLMKECLYMYTTSSTNKYMCTNGCAVLGTHHTLVRSACMCAAASCESMGLASLY